MYGGTSEEKLPDRSPSNMSPDLAVDLLRRIADSKDQAAFSSLFEYYAPRVKSYMLRQGANATTAEELAQEAMTSVWRKAGLYSPEKGNPTTWIFTIARNLRIDRLRKERVWQELPEGHAERPSEDPEPDEVVSERERGQMVRDALATLPPEQIEIVTLSFLNGLSHSEIAEKLDLPLGTVKSRMRLAYDKMRPLLEDLS